MPNESAVPALLRRTALAVGLILAVAILLWFDRDGLRDNAHPNRPVGFVDILYFTVVSLTTVGYGDITPITDGARLINAILLTPVRIFLWALFLGSAYEVSVLRFRLREERQMRRLRERLADHAVICGYGVVGQTIAAELLAHGHAIETIVVVDQDEEAVAAAGKHGFIAFRGDASSEETLRAASVDRAAEVLIAPNRDDACVLISLTVRSLAPKVHLVAAVREEENIKLLYGAGADLVIAPSVSGGRLMATAVRQTAVPHFLEDLLSYGRGVDIAERVVQPEEAGKLPSELADLPHAVIVGVVRDNEHLSLSRLRDLRLAAGDTIVYLVEPAGSSSSADLVSRRQTEG